MADTTEKTAIQLQYPHHRWILFDVTFGKPLEECPYRKMIQTNPIVPSGMLARKYTESIVLSVVALPSLEKDKEWKDNLKRGKEWTEMYELLYNIVIIQLETRDDKIKDEKKATYRLQLDLNYKPNGIANLFTSDCICIEQLSGKPKVYGYWLLTPTEYIPTQQSKVVSSDYSGRFKHGLSQLFHYYKLNDPKTTKQIAYMDLFTFLSSKSLTMNKVFIDKWIPSTPGYDEWLNEWLKQHPQKKEPIPPPPPVTLDVPPSRDVPPSTSVKPPIIRDIQKKEPIPPPPVTLDIPPVEPSSTPEQLNIFKRLFSKPTIVTHAEVEKMMLKSLRLKIREKKFIPPIRDYYKIQQWLKDIIDYYSLKENENASWTQPEITELERVAQLLWDKYIRLLRGGEWEKLGSKDYKKKAELLLVVLNDMERTPMEINLARFGKAQEKNHSLETMLGDVGIGKFFASDNIMDENDLYGTSYEFKDLVSIIKPTGSSVEKEQPKKSLDEQPSKKQTTYTQVSYGDQKKQKLTTYERKNIQAYESTKIANTMVGGINQTQSAFTAQSKELSKLNYRPVVLRFGYPVVSTTESTITQPDVIVTNVYGTSPVVNGYKIDPIIITSAIPSFTFTQDNKNVNVRGKWLERDENDKKIGVVNVMISPDKVYINATKTFQSNYRIGSEIADLFKNKIKGLENIELRQVFITLVYMRMEMRQKINLSLLMNLINRFNEVIYKPYYHHLKNKQLKQEEIEKELKENGFTDLKNNVIGKFYASPRSSKTTEQGVIANSLVIKQKGKYTMDSKFSITIFVTANGIIQITESRRLRDESSAVSLSKTNPFNLKKNSNDPDDPNALYTTRIFPYLYPLFIAATKNI